MEKETCEDTEVARLMNDAFVPIKVDREERPDIDHIYMTVSQMMTGSGGWPLNIIMSPDKKPFFAGTYFPKESRQGRLGMVDLSRRIKDLWTTKREEVMQSAGKIMLALRQAPDDSPGETLGADVCATAFQQLAQRHDRIRGGFSAAPKFPTSHNLLFLLRYWKRTNDAKALEMVENTLQAMRMGGIYDHIGFGFHRYSTDAEWLVPHFEKMLYDQAMIAMAYIEAYQATGKAEYEKTAEEILAYVLRDMTAPEGAFYSAEDADSEGEEGKFYVWKIEEAERALDRDEFDLITRVYNLWPAGNFHEEATGRLTGSNIPHLKEPILAIAARLGVSPEELENRLEKVRQKLFAARERRIHPHKDDKILTDWNGLMIAALAKGAQALHQPEFSDAAKKAADFFLSIMRDGQGRLLHRYRDGEAALPSHVDDYAFLIWGLLELYEATFEVRYLRAALDLNKDFMERFWDGHAGGFFFTAEDSESLLMRKKEAYDGATPSGNSVAALDLLRLGRITADESLERRAEQIGRTFSGSIRQFPSAYTQMLIATEFAVGPSREIVIAGRPGAADTEEMLRGLRSLYLPNKIVVFRPSGDGAAQIEAIAQYTKHEQTLDNRATAYVCVNYNCELPTADPKKMVDLLEAT